MEPAKVTEPPIGLMNPVAGPVMAMLGVMVLSTMTLNVCSVKRPGPSVTRTVKV